MPSEQMFKLMNSLHRVTLKVTGGKVGWKGSGMPVVQLTTTGAKTGQPRTVMLTSPYQDGETMAVVASKGGADQNPAWLANIKANPEVRVVLAGKPERKMRAHIADAEERARLWPRITKDHKNYAGYQTKTTREIPVVLLEPIT